MTGNAGCEFAIGATPRQVVTAILIGKSNWAWASNNSVLNHSAMIFFRLPPTPFLKKYFVSAVRLGM